MLQDRIGKLIKVEWRNLQPLQPDNAKHIYNYKDLENSIIKYGFSQPFYVWEHNGEYYCIDGHTRKEVLSNIENVPDTLSAITINVKDRKEAVKILVEVYNQKHNPFDRPVLIEMLETEEVDIDEVDLKSINIQTEKNEDEPEGGNLGIFPLSIILNAREYKDFQLFKKENRLVTDTEAFRTLFEAKQSIEQ